MMKWFYNLRIGVKLIIGFLVVAFIGAIIGIMALVNISDIVKVDEQLYVDNVHGIQYAGEAHTYYQRLRFNLVEAILKKDSSGQDNYITKINDCINGVEENLKLYETYISNDYDKGLYDELYTMWDQYKTDIQQVIKFIESGLYARAEEALFTQADSLGDSILKLFLQLTEYNAEQAQLKSNQNSELASTASISMIVIVIVAIIISVILAIFMSRIISNPVKNLTKIADQIALGDVDVNIDVTTKDELGELMASLGRMIENIRAQTLAAAQIAEGDMTIEVPVRSEKDILGKKLAELVEKNNEVLSNIRSASDQVAAGARQVSDSSIAISQGAAEQASSIEELTSSIEEIASQTQLNATHADEANSLANTAKKNAKYGDERMQEMLGAMKEINESSNNIYKIIKVIDDIAFQTNILALNAAVEAARAGQHGKGFAVVAEEVRNLAARSASAAKETTDLIENSMKKAEDGTAILNETASALVEIIDSIDKVANIVNDIARASNEQAVGIEQINQGIMQVSNVVQSNSATSEESATASEELSSQAQLLKELIAQYKLKKMSLDL